MGATSFPRCRDRMGATSYIAQCGATQISENCVPKGRDINTDKIYWSGSKFSILN